MTENALGHGSVPPYLAHARAVLEINLAAIRRNWRKLNGIAAKSVCSAVVKADAYGLGLEKIVATLYGDGCTTFFVATLDEGRRTRLAAPGATIYVLDGLLPQTAAYYRDFNLCPVLSSTEEITDWADFCTNGNLRMEAAVQVDTGMHRLGLPIDQFVQLQRPGGPLEVFSQTLLMSHLACADTQHNIRNRQQLEKFEKAHHALPAVPCSLANSAGIFLGTDFHFDMVRPGIALYGGRAFEGAQNPMESVVKLYGRILQLHSAEPGEAVGYGATHLITRPSRLATISLGYADGFVRALGGSETGFGTMAFIDSYEVPIIGRISMDLITLDVTDVPTQLVHRGGWVEMIGNHVTVDDLADRIGTIGYEILSRLGRRAHRVYVGSQV